MNKSMNFCGSNLYILLNENEILAELSESRMLYDSGEGEELEKVINLFGSYANNTFTDESNLDFLHHSFGWCIRYCSGDDEGL